MYVVDVNVKIMLTFASGICLSLLTITSASSLQPTSYPTVLPTTYPTLTPTSNPSDDDWTREELLNGLLVDITITYSNITISSDSSENDDISSAFISASIDTIDSITKIHDLYILVDNPVTYSTVSAQITTTLIVWFRESDMLLEWEVASNNAAFILDFESKLRVLWVDNGVDTVMDFSVIDIDGDDDSGDGDGSGGGVDTDWFLSNESFYCYGLFGFVVFCLLLIVVGHQCGRNSNNTNKFKLKFRWISIVFYCIYTLDFVTGVW